MALRNRELHTRNDDDDCIYYIISIVFNHLAPSSKEAASARIIVTLVLRPLDSICFVFCILVFCPEMTCKTGQMSVRASVYAVSTFSNPKAVRLFDRRR